MTVYNKLKIAILAIMTSHTVHAITIDPIQIQSGAGDLLYAEMKFRNSDPNEKIEVSLANAEDMLSVGFANQPPGHLNFYTRRSSDGTGVIVITSSRPVIDPELNILLKINEGQATHLKQIKTPLTRNHVNAPAMPLNAQNNEKVLTPQVVVSEKDIALNLPTSTQYQTVSPYTQAETAHANNRTNTLTAERPLIISVVAPPALQNEAPKTTTSITVQNTPAASASASQENVITTAIPIAQSLSASAMQPQVVAKDVAKTETAPATATQESHAEVAKSENTPVKSDSTKPSSQSQEKNRTETAQQNHAKHNDAQQHVVQANESLWKIAARVASATNQSIPDVMKQIKANNANAFIQGDVNRIRRGAALNLAASYKQPPQIKYKILPAPTIARKQSGSAKYRLDQAEMSLVADNEQNSAQGSSKKNTDANQTGAELSRKVMTSREKTVKLQKNVNQLASALQQKNQRIQLLNARLAQLQQQLQQQSVKKPNS